VRRREADREDASCDRLAHRAREPEGRAGGKRLDHGGRDDAFIRGIPVKPRSHDPRPTEHGPIGLEAEAHPDIEIPDIARRLPAAQERRSDPAQGVDLRPLCGGCRRGEEGRKGKTGERVDRRRARPFSP
jgi:hypothetical protein